MNPTPAPESPLVASPYDLRVALGERVGEIDTRRALESGDLAFVHSFTTGSAVDGPGVRVVVWLTGCQFRCQFCHNPDTWKLHNGIPVTIGRAVEEVRKYRYGLQTMHGGLTVSGGEPLLQDRFVVRLFSSIKEAKIHTALDTNGAFGARLSDAELEFCDLVMLGLKALDPALHQRLTGQDNGPVLAFARRLALLRRPMWIRYVLVPGLTDDPEQLRGIAQLAAELGNVEKVEVLPFHQLGRFKWEKLGMEYALAETSPPAAEQVERAIAIFRSTGLKVD